MLPESSKSRPKCLTASFQILAGIESHLPMIDPRRESAQKRRKKVYSADTYWIKDGKRYRLISDRAAQSWCFTTVLATEAALSGIKLVGKLGFRDGTLIKSVADGKMYLVSQNKLRHIVDPDLFNRYGLDRSKMIEVSEKEISAHDLGENI